mgnify:CR=1 FL=1
MKKCLVLNNKNVAGDRTSDFLSTYEFEIEFMSDGEQALSLCEQIMPDVILVDSKMSKMDGQQFLERLAVLRRARHSQPPVILFCLDKTDVDAMGRAVWSGATECLVKPFDADILDFKLQQAGAI